MFSDFFFVFNNHLGSPTESMERRVMFNSINQTIESLNTDIRFWDLVANSDNAWNGICRKCHRQEVSQIHLLLTVDTMLVSTVRRGCISIVNTPTKSMNLCTTQAMCLKFSNSSHRTHWGREPLLEKKLKNHARDLRVMRCTLWGTRNRYSTILIITSREVL